MVRKLHIASLPALTAVMAMSCASPLMAEELPPMAMDAQYVFMWGNIPFGNLHLKADEQEKSYLLNSKVRTTGLANLFSRHESDTSVKVTQPAESIGDFTKAARDYECNYSTRGKPKHVKMTYANGGNVKDRLVEPPEPPEKRTLPTAEQQRGSLDPLTYVPAVRQRVHDAIENNESAFTLKLFDGRRLADTNFRVLGRKTLDEGQKVVEVAVVRVPIAGYTEKELKKMKDEPEVRIQFSDDDRFIPLVVSTQLAFGTVSAVFRRECTSADPCDETPQQNAALKSE